MNILVINWNERLQRCNKSADRLFSTNSKKNLYDYLLYYIYFFLWIGILIKMRRLTKGICRKLSFHTWNVIHKSFLIFLVDLQQQLYTCLGKVLFINFFKNTFSLPFLLFLCEKWTNQLVSVYGMLFFAKWQTKFIAIR